MRSRSSRISSLMAHIEYIVTASVVCGNDEEFSENLADHEDDIKNLRKSLSDLYIKLRTKRSTCIDIGELKLTLSQIQVIYKPLLLIYEKWEESLDLSPRSFLTPC